MEKITLKGYAGAIDGTKLLVDLFEYGLLKVKIEDDKQRWELYCQEIEVTIEGKGKAYLKEK